MDSAHYSPKFWTGFLLAGGASKRMGKCKADLKVSPRANQTFLQHSWSLLETVSVDQWLLGDHSHVPLDQRFIDRSTFSGPLKALVDALPEVDTEWVLLIPVDMPGLTSEILFQFQQFALQNPKGCVTLDAQGRSGFPVALPRSRFDSVLRAVEAGETSLFRVLETMQFAQWNECSNQDLKLKNINTPEQFVAWHTAMEPTWELAK